MIKRATQSISQDPAPEAPTFDRIARKRMRQHITRYRELLAKHVSGQNLTEDELAEVLDVLQCMGLPDFAWSRDIEGMRTAAKTTAKLRDVVKEQDGLPERVASLAKQVADARAKLQALTEEHRSATVRMGKPATYAQRLRELEVEYPHAMGDIEQAITMRLEAINTRRREQVTA